MAGLSDRNLSICVGGSGGHILVHASDKLSLPECVGRQV